MMRDLPPTPFTEVSYKRLKVDRNWHITCDYQYYSVPWKLAGKFVDVQLFDDQHSRLCQFLKEGFALIGSVGCGVELVG